MKRPLLCIIEDDPIMGESLADRFDLEGFEIDWHKSGGSALRALERRSYAAVISDIRLPDISGDSLFDQVSGHQPRVPPFVFITGYGSIEAAVRLMHEGAADYVTKPFDIGLLVGKVRALTNVSSTDGGVESGLGVSDPMVDLESTLPRLAARASKILITGESGVGKEVVARRIHALAPNAGPFVPINCGALPDGLLETELFGYERGAYTGADRRKRGVFEAAEGGTLFLDEIGDLPLGLQVKLLRALQESRIKRVGGDEEIPTSFKLICATNRSLADQVTAGRFREDLFFRINIVQLRIPPLRERRADIPWLTDRMLIEIAAALKEAPRRLHSTARAELVAYDWPGNVRELRNRLERACIVAERLVLLASDVFEERGSAAGVDSPPGASLNEYLSTCERAYISEVLARHDGRISASATALGISRKNLWEKMRRHQMEPR
jgi:DNA-binding NtrC family response regulator